MIWFFVIVLGLFFFFIKKKNEDISVEEKEAEKWRENFFKREGEQDNLFEKLLSSAGSSEFQRSLVYLKEKVKAKKDKPLIEVVEESFGGGKSIEFFDKISFQVRELTSVFKRLGLMVKGLSFSPYLPLVKYLKYLPDVSNLNCLGTSLLYSSGGNKKLLSSNTDFFTLGDVGNNKKLLFGVCGFYSDIVFLLYTGGSSFYVGYRSNSRSFSLKLEFKDVDRCLLFLMMLADFKFRVDKDFFFLGNKGLEEKELEVFRGSFYDRYAHENKTNDLPARVKDFKEWKNIQDYYNGVEEIKANYQRKREEYRKQKMFGSEK